jgi:DNA-binding transcriptional ArsR family regulator
VIQRNPDELAVTEPAVMRAMAHPARLAILEYLGGGREATATECAEVCGLSPSATSYHLRALAKAGLIEEAPSRGDGRERVWRAPPVMISLDSDDDSPEARQAELDLVYVVLAHEDSQARRWFGRASQERGEWAQSAAILHKGLLVSAAELAEVSQRLLAVMEPYKASSRTDAPPGARRVAIHLRILPTFED